jgi:integrase
MFPHQPDADQDAEHSGNVAASNYPAALLAVQASPVNPNRKGNRMRKQKGYVFRAGDHWLIRYRDSRVVDGQVIRKQMATILCPVDPKHKRLKRPTPAILKEAERFMAKMNDSTVAPERMLTIGDFVTQVWLPYLESELAESTQHAYGYYWFHILSPRCGTELLRDFSTVTGQWLLDSIARENREMKKATLRRLKSQMSGILKLAIKRGYRAAPNPMRETSLPRAPESEETEAYDLDSVFTLIRLLPEPDRTMVATAAFTGLRKSEMRGLEWPDYDGKNLNVTRSLWRSFVGKPKSRASRASVPVIPVLQQMLDAHHARAGKPAEGFIFRGLRLGRPIDPDNLVHDHIKPALLKAKSPVRWLGWHAFRRGLATNLHAMGVDDKTIQRILRHSNVSVTQDCYIKTRDETVDAAMDKFNSEVSRLCSNGASIVQ